jgi:hypothetical protein
MDRQLEGVQFITTKHVGCAGCLRPLALGTVAIKATAGPYHGDCWADALLAEYELLVARRAATEARQQQRKR